MMGVEMADMMGAGAGEESCSARVEIVNELEQREEETSLVCTCDSQPFLCELCHCRPCSGSGWDGWGGWSGWGG